MLSFLFEKVLASAEVNLSTQKLAQELLEACLKDKRCYIVLDGLDECSRNQQLHITKWLRKFVEDSAASEPSRCVFLSQDDASTRPLLSTLPTLHIEPAQNRQDIQAFCDIRVASMKEKFALTPSEMVSVSAKTTVAANGTYIAHSRALRGTIAVLTKLQACSCLQNWSC